ncbi:MAG: hypothetical protein ACOY5B_09390 [Spirochaetota bacterium]
MIYKELKIIEYIGEQGNQYFNGLFVDQAGNLAAIISGLQQGLSNIVKAQQFLAIITSFPTMREYVEAKDRALLSIDYTNSVTAYGLKELAIVSRNWNFTLIALARVAKTTDTNFQIETVQKGSLTVIASAAYAVAKAFLSLADKILDIRKKAAEIRKIRAETEKIMAETPQKKAILENFRQSETIEVVTESVRITEEIMVQFEWSETDGQYHEVKANLAKAVERTINFIQEEGQMGVINEVPDQKELKLVVSKKYEEIRKITKSIKQIEGPAE